MSNQAKPIFVIGSPRSGTSILTWCLGQHPNILPLPETSWIGKFAVDLGSTYELGAARGPRSHLSAMGTGRDEFYETFGESIDALVLAHRTHRAAAGPGAPFQRVRSALDPKRRWVDGTPEYSFHVVGLLWLFPQARFIHILRDVAGVVKSLMNFAAAPVRYSEQAAYDYWLRTVSACVQAERAFGSDRVLRIGHSDLVRSPEATLRACLDWLAEPFCTDCLEPLATRINSSRVPDGFSPFDERTDPELRRAAKELSAQLLADGRPCCGRDELLVDRLEAAFLNRVRFVGSLDADRLRCLEALKKAEGELAERTRQLAELQAVVDRLSQNLQASEAQCDGC